MIFSFILTDEIEGLDESDDVIIFPSEESWAEIDGNKINFIFKS